MENEEFKKENYDTDISADDTEDIDFLEEDEDIGSIDDFEETQEKPKFLFNKDKKPLDKKSILIIVGGALIFIMMILLAVPGMIKKSVEKNNEQTEQQTITEQPVYTGDNAQLNNPEAQNLNLGNEQQNGVINVNQPCDRLNPNNPANINNPNCANVGVNQPQPNEVVSAQQPQQNQVVAAQQPQQAVNPVYSSPAPVYQGFQERAIPTMPQYQPRNIQKPSSGSLNSLSGTKNNNSPVNNNDQNTNAPLANNQQTQNNSNTGNTTNQQARTRNYQPKANGITTYSLQQGSYIPITITTQMNSDNPSYFTAIVSENVYSKDGKHKILIPMGSKLLGNYAALKNNNDTRMFMMVEKIILPNNKIIQFTNANIVDLKGEIGARGKLNTKLFQRLGKSLMALSFSVADVVIDYRKSKAALQNSDRLTRRQWEDLIDDPVGSVKETMDVVDKSWNSVKNRIKIPIGTRLNVLTGNEIVLEEYKRR